KLRSVAGGRRELVVEIDAGEEGGDYGGSIEQAYAAFCVKGAAWAVRDVEKHVDRDGKEKHSNRAAGRGNVAGIDGRGRDADRQDPEQGDEGSSERVAVKLPIAHPQQACEHAQGGKRERRMRTRIPNRNRQRREQQG